jgi:hypothetical protein
VSGAKEMKWEDGREREIVLVSANSRGVPLSLSLLSGAPIMPPMDEGRPGGVKQLIGPRQNKNPFAVRGWARFFV